MTTMDISPALVTWAAKSEFSWKSEGYDEPMRFFSLGGEERYYFRVSADEPGWIDITNASRSGGEQHLFSARNLDVAERFFWGLFGSDRRCRMQLPRLRIPIRADQVARGFCIELPEPGQSRLVDPDGENVMAATSDISDVANLVRTSHWMSVPLTVLKESYSDPEGRLAFPLPK